MAARSNVLNMLVSFTGCLIWCFHLLSSLSAKLSEPFSRFTFDGRIRELCRSQKCQTTVWKWNGRAIIWLCESICFEFSGSLATCPWHDAGKSPVTSLDSVIYSVFSGGTRLFVMCRARGEWKKTKRGLIKHNRKCCFQPLWLGSIYQKVLSPKKYINFE